MTFDIEINGRMRRVAVRKGGAGFEVTVDGRAFDVDAVRIDAQTLSLIVSGVDGAPRRLSSDVTVARNGTAPHISVGVGPIQVVAAVNGRRGAGRRQEANSGDGPDRVVAPMPGRIVRVLVQAGEAVRTRQPLVVVEAMKMENELRASRDGTVAELHAREGQSVDAGALLVVVQ